MRNASLGRALLGLFILSGFAGLIYQSIWSHYLGLVLGHAAYAQTLVLAIFMGGMAIGAWLASRRTDSWRHLILAYAVIELVVGVIGLLFHPLFLAYVGFSQDTVLPAISSSVLGHSYQWISSACLMLPQCILLGMTFPILSAGYLRLAPDQPGEVLGGLYFTNSLGAALGALATAFVLLPWIGMPGTMFTAGILNIFVALGAWVIWKLTREESELASSTNTSDNATTQVDPESKAIEPDALRRLGKVVLAASFITGASSFIYEIGWVRLLNLALGTTIHSFELMLAAFILGLAFGGLWIRRKASRIFDAIKYAAYAQVLMGLAALFSLVVLANSFEWMGWLMQSLARNDTGYTLFTGGSAVIAMLVMFPAAFFAGMTLPLFTLALLRSGGGERQIGRVYAFNTLGAIVGVLLMVHVLVPLLGVRFSIMLAALMDAALGFYLIRFVSPARQTAGLGLAFAATFAFTLAASFWGRIAPEVLSGGVYRTTQPSLQAGLKVPFLRDGKTATVSLVVDKSGITSIATNGKPDAALTPTLAQRPTGDEITMIMAGVMPLIVHPKPEEVAIIGWGSGLTTHTLLGSKVPTKVDTIEIEKVMYDAARAYGARVARAYQDPRSHVHIDDARTYFSMGNRKYDVIVSEPSNPWVNGVASLFTVEFYHFLRNHLKEGGILVQWIQAYELNDKLLATMIAALLEEFPDSEMYVTTSSNILLVARTKPSIPFNGAALQQEPLKSELARVGLSAEQDFSIRRVGGGAVLNNFVRSQGVGVHSDFFPTVALQAPRSRFRQDAAMSLMAATDNGMPLREIMEGYVEIPSDTISPNTTTKYGASKLFAAAIKTSLMGGTTDAAASGGNVSTLSEVLALRDISSKAIEEKDIALWTQLVSLTAGSSLSQLAAREQKGLWVDPVWIDKKIQPEAVNSVLTALAATASRDRAAMFPTAVAVLMLPGGQISPDLREQMLVQAQLGAIAQGQYAWVAELERKFGDSIPQTGRYGFTRQLLSRWAYDRDQPAPTDTD